MHISAAGLLGAVGKMDAGTAGTLGDVDKMDTGIRQAFSNNVRQNISPP